MTNCIDPITHCVECGAQLSVFNNVRCRPCFSSFCQLSIDEQNDANRAAAARLQANDRLCLTRKKEN
jgi:hypothetical protein